MRRKLVAAAIAGVLTAGLIAMPAQAGLTQWLIAKGIYDPNAPNGTPNQTPPPTGACNG